MEVFFTFKIFSSYDPGQPKIGSGRSSINHNVDSRRLSQVMIPKQL